MENINPIKLKAFQGLKSLARDKLKEKSIKEQKQEQMTMSFGV